MEILVSGENHTVLNLVFSLCMSGCLVKVRDAAMTASLFHQQTLFAEATINCRLVIPLLYAAFRQSVPSQILFSITSGFVESHLKTANFYSERPLKLVFAALISTVRSNTAIW
jgi:hypothetical protein